MRYKILNDLKRISQNRETIKLGELLRMMNQEKDADTSLMVKHICRARYAVEIKDSNIDRYNGTKVDVVIVGANMNVTLNDDCDFYVVACFCRNSSKYCFSHWDMTDNRGVSYRDIDNNNSRAIQ